MEKLIGQKVKAYRNLNNGLFSVKTDKVQGHTPSLILSQVTFTGAHTKAQALIEAGGHRSVHAYAVGTLLCLSEGHPQFSGLIEVTYTPKTRAGFYLRYNQKEVTQADIVILINGKMFAINAR